jgi:hypothetical protein
MPGGLRRLIVRLFIPDTQISRHNSIDNLNPPTKLIILTRSPLPIDFIFWRKFFFAFHDSSLKKHKDAFPTKWIVSIAALCEYTRYNPGHMAFSSTVSHFYFIFWIEKGFFFPSREGQCRMYTNGFTNGSPIQYTWLDKRWDTPLGVANPRAENAWRWWGFTI